MGAPRLFDLAGRGTVVLAGRDRATFLHGLVTNDVKKLRPGEGCAAAFLTPKGKLLAECVVLAEGDRLLLDTPPELAATVEALLRKYLVFNDVTIANETPGTSVLHLAGEAAGDEGETEDFLRRVIGLGTGDPLPRDPHSSHAAQITFKENPPAGASGILVVGENRTGVAGYDLRVPSSLWEEISSSLVSAGARPATDEELDRRRIRAGIPRWGAELTEAVLPDEARLRERGFVSDTKGCYVGQETVARIKTYGHVNRLLVRLAVSGGVPAVGDGVIFEGERAGVLTSVAPAEDQPGAGTEPASVALAYVKRDLAAEGTALTISPLEETPSSPRSLPALVAPAPLV